MENKSHAMAAGAFVLIVSALLVGLALWLTRDTTVSRTYELSSRESVTGLQPQAGVRFKGVAIGKVESIGFDPAIPGNVLIRISTDDSIAITRSAFGTLGFQGVTGLAFVQLDDKGESKDLLVSPNESPPRIPMRPGLLSNLSDQGTKLLSQVDETSRRLNLLLAEDNQKAVIAAVVQIGEAANGIKAAAGNLAQFSSNANRVLDAQFGPERMNLPLLAQDLTVTLKALQGTATSANTNLDRVGASSDEIKLLASEFKNVAKSISQPGGALDKLTESAQSLAAVGQSLNSGTLPRLNRVTDEAARTARQLNRTATAVTDNPQSLIYGNGAALPGPGEAGFVAPQARP